MDLLEANEFGLPLKGPWEDILFTSLFRGVMGPAIGAVGKMGALEALEKDIEGVLGRGVFVGLPLRDDENVEMRRSQNDFVVSGPML